MGLLIHDLSPGEWKKISSDYNGWDIVTCGDDIHPCFGCSS